MINWLELHSRKPIEQLVAILVGCKPNLQLRLQMSHNDACTSYH
jgi:hypothetical protein